MVAVNGEMSPEGDRRVNRGEAKRRGRGKGPTTDFRGTSESCTCWRNEFPGRLPLIVDRPFAKPFSPSEGARERTRVSRSGIFIAVRRVRSIGSYDLARIAVAKVESSRHSEGGSSLDVKLGDHWYHDVGTVDPCLCDTVIKMKATACSDPLSQNEQRLWTRGLKSSDKEFVTLKDQLSVESANRYLDISANTPFG